MTSLPWFRFYSEAIGDIKFSKIARTCGMSKPEVMGAWLMILCAASDSPERGSLYVTLQERYTIDDVTELLGFTKRKTQKFILSLVKMDMLKCKYGVFYIVNWDKRQYASDNSGDRVRKHREIKKMKQVSNVTVTPSDTDTDTDIYTGEISTAFTKETNITPYKLDQWDEATQTMTRAGVTCENMKSAIKKLNDSNMSITGPWSIVKTAIAEHANPNGRKKRGMRGMEGLV